MQPLHEVEISYLQLYQYITLYLRNGTKLLYNVNMKPYVIY